MYIAQLAPLDTIISYMLATVLALMASCAKITTDEYSAVHVLEIKNIDEHDVIHARELIELLRMVRNRESCNTGRRHRNQQGLQMTDSEQFCPFSGTRKRARKKWECREWICHWVESTSEEIKELRTPLPLFKKLKNNQSGK